MLHYYLYSSFLEHYTINQLKFLIFYFSDLIFVEILLIKLKKDKIYFNIIKAF